MHLDTVRTALYRLLDQDGKLLYVGITHNVGDRMQSHAATKAWWPEVVRQEVEWFPDRATALAAEVKAIAAEAPAYNLRDSPWAPKPRDLEPNEIAVAQARSNLSELVTRVRMLRTIIFLTSNTRRQVAIVPLEVGELVHKIGADEAAKMLAGAPAPAPAASPGPDAAPEPPRRGLPAPVVPDHTTRLELNGHIPQWAYSHVRALAWDRPEGHLEPEEYSLMIYNIAVAAGLL